MPGRFPDRVDDTFGDAAPPRLGMGKLGPTSIFDRTESGGLIAARSARGKRTEVARESSRHDTGAPVVVVDRAFSLSSLTTEIYNEFPVQPGRKFTRARGRARTDRGT